MIRKTIAIHVQEITYMPGIPYGCASSRKCPPYSPHKLVGLVKRFLLVHQQDPESIDEKICAFINKRFDQLDPKKILTMSEEELVTRLVATGHSLSHHFRHAFHLTDIIPLPEAAFDENEVRQLLGRGYDPNERDAGGELALCEAAKLGNLKIVRLLVKHGVDFSGTDSDGLTSLHYAVGCHDEKERNEEMTRDLLDGEADLAVRDSRGDTPLHRAISSEEVDMAAFLLAQGADSSKKNEYGLSAEDLAFFLDEEGFNFLYNAHRDSFGGEGSSSNRNELFAKLFAYACVKSDKGFVLEWTMRHLGLHPDFVNEKNEHGQTALHIAALHGYDDIVRALLSNIADINVQDKNQRTARDLAEENEHASVVEIFDRALAALQE